jgi:hypothetical protein
MEKAHRVPVCLAALKRSGGVPQFGYTEITLDGFPQEILAMRTTGFVEKVKDDAQSKVWILRLKGGMTCFPVYAVVKINNICWAIGGLLDCAAFGGIHFSQDASAMIFGKYLRPGVSTGLVAGKEFALSLTNAREDGSDAQINLLGASFYAAMGGTSPPAKSTLVQEGSDYQLETWRFNSPTQLTISTQQKSLRLSPKRVDAGDGVLEQLREEKRFNRVLLVLFGPVGLVAIVEAVILFLIWWYS